MGVTSKIEVKTSKENGCLYEEGRLTKFIRRNKKEIFKEIVAIDLDMCEDSIRMGINNLMRYYSKVIRLLFKKFSGTGIGGKRKHTFEGNR